MAARSTRSTSSVRSSRQLWRGLRKEGCAIELENQLATGELEVGGKVVDLKAITMPVLNIYTETDHIIPAPASKALHDKVGTQDYTEAPVSGGHIGVFVSRQQAKLREQIVGWLEKR